jgi:hypothetical protein
MSNNQPEYEKRNGWSAEQELDVPTPTLPSENVVFWVEGYHACNLHGV